MNNSANQLRKEVFECKFCTTIEEFQSPALEQPFYKFPPIIGAQKRTSLLFIGINPHRSGSNQDLHDWLMKSPHAFEQHAGNRDRFGQPYIALGARAKHYHCHMMVVEGVFGKGAKFEDNAAVTELFLCASENGSSLLDLGKSPCAERFLSRVNEIVQPSVVIAVGWKVFNHLEQHFRETIKSRVEHMEHPWHLRRLNDEGKRSRLQPTIKKVQEVLRSNLH